MDDRGDRVRSMLLGVAIGDALGWPFERPNRVAAGPDPDGAFFRWRRRAGSRFWSYEEALPSGTYSDDTQLTLATARSLRREDWFAHLVSRELPTWRLYERGAGATVLRSSAAWARGTAPWRDRPESQARYFESGANGAAMRVAGHAAVGGDFLPRVVSDAIATHGHPRALLGATLQAWSLRAAIQGELGRSATDALAAAGDNSPRWGDPALLDTLPTSWRQAAGGDYEQQWNKDLAHALQLLATAQRAAERGAIVAEGEVLAELGATDPETAGAGDVCAIATLYLAGRYASQPAHALRAAARQPGADTDTLASMVGALLGAWIGHEAIATFPGVQDAETITALATDLLTTAPPTTRIVDQLDPKPAKAVDAFLLELASAPERVVLPDGRSAQLLKQRSLSDPQANNQVTGHYLRCEDGQGLLVIDRSRRETSHQKDDPTHESVAARAAAEAEPSESEPASAPPMVCTLRVTDPDEVVKLLTCVGLSGTPVAGGWQLDEIPLILAGTQEATPKLPLDDLPVSVELQLMVADLDAVRTDLERDGWKPAAAAEGMVVIAAGLALHLTSKAPTPTSLKQEKRI